MGGGVVREGLADPPWAWWGVCGGHRGGDASQAERSEGPQPPTSTSSVLPSLLRPPWPPALFPRVSTVLPSWPDSVYVRMGASSLQSDPSE